MDDERAQGGPVRGDEIRADQLTADAGAESSNAIDGGGDRDAVDIVDARPHDATDAPDAFTCSPSLEVAYKTPGCGSNAPAPYCQARPDGCTATYCGCDDVTFQSACGFSTKPYAKSGTCGDGTAPFDTGTPDALVCGTFESVAYNTPGCGSAAPAPYCQGVTDACAQSFCGCDGLTFLGGCGFSQKPFASAGACPGDGGDASD